jgi:hypothetical protein
MNVIYEGNGLTYQCSGKGNPTRSAKTGRGEILKLCTHAQDTFQLILAYDS